MNAPIDTNPTADDVLVTQADREAAATVALRHMTWTTRYAIQVAEGEHDDNWLIQAFAHHRLRTPPPIPCVPEDLKALVEKVADLLAIATPGPWEYDAVRGLIYHRPDTLTKYVIADMESSIEANAHLIAAAPEALSQAAQAILALVAREKALVEGLKAALPVLEHDLLQAKEYSDADWEGQAFERLERARALIPQPIQGNSDD